MKKYKIVKIMCCVKCKKELEVGLALWYCPNKKCSRFGLGTEIYRKGKKKIIDEG